jgi:PAS domain S-box-containing protein
METSLEKLIEASEVFPAAIIVADSTGAILRANRQTEVLFGYSREELTGQRIELLAPERLRDLHIRHRHAYQASPHTRRMGLGIDLMARRKDGSEFPVEISLSPITEDHGTLVVAMIHDISVRKSVEEELKRSEERYRSLVENAVFGIYRTNSHGQFIHANPALCSILGYESQEELLAKDLRHDIFPDPGHWAQLTEKFRRHNRIDGMDVVWKRKDEKPVTVRLNGVAMRDTLGEICGYEMIAEDVTQRRILEEQLLQSQKMEGIARLAGSIVHDFNNLMAVIAAQGELVLDQMGEHPLRKDIELMASTAEKAAALTGQLLAFSRRQELETRILNLNRLVAGMDQMLQRLLGEDVKLAFVLEPDLENVSADPGRMEQVIMNLVVNARDAMPSGGKLTIETANVELDAFYAREHLDVTPGRHVMVAVSDTGVGMSADVRARIFEPFFTTKPTGQGTGLGLSTVYGIVRQSGGHIWVYTEPGQGTTFRVYLPSVDVPAEEGSREQSPVLTTQGGKTILLIEDEERLRESIRTVLERAGYTVLAASDGVEAIQICRERSRPVDLVLTDVGLPRIRGPEVVQQLQELYPNLQAIYMSGFGDNAFKPNEARQLSGRLLQKPFRKDVLLQKLQGILQ